MAEPRLAACGLTRRFPGGAGVNDVDLQVSAGEIHAIVGLNGAGKTTLMRLLLGMLKPTSGYARIDGVDILAAPAPIWAGVGHLVERPFAYPELDSRANLLIAALLHGVSRKGAPATVERVMTELDLDDYRHIRARRLSQGNRQRVGLAAALQHHPAVIVLDEPTTSLDPAGVIRLREALLRRARAGAGILVSSHHLDEVARIADRITVLNRGHVVGTLDPGGTDIERSFFDLVLVDDQRSLA